MPLKVLGDVTKEFQLTKSDKKFENKGDPTVITIRQATQGDFEARNDLFAKFKRQYDGDTVTVEQTISFDAVRRKEVFMTLVDCNITDGSGKEEKPLFRFKNGKLTSEAEFNLAWSRLHPYVANEISECVLEMNPLWSSEGELED